MEIVKSDDYEEIAANYQCLEFARLNETLKKYGITDFQTRRSICSEYFFHSGYFLDLGWFVSEGKKLWPKLCFAERPANPGYAPGEIQKLHVVSDSFEYHEYALGSSDWYFVEHDEDISEIEAGSG